jgi:hypothetical protein
MAHISKLRRFLACAPPAHRHAIAHVNILIAAIRNRVLYPVPDGAGGHNAPEDAFTAANARDLLQRVQGVYDVIAALL